MEFKINKNDFLRGLQVAHGIADRKATLQILANVLIRTEGKDKVVLAATDLSVSALATLPAKVDKEGGLTVSARQLFEIVKGLAGDEVRVKRNEQNWVELRAGKAEFKVVGMADRDYPKLPAVQEATTTAVDAATLRDMISKTIFAVSLDETRQHLAGVLFESDGTTARMVSTDGHRLCKVGRPMSGGPKLEQGILIPRKGILEIRRVLEGREGSCQIGVHQGQFVFRADDLTISAKLLDGQFPPYDQVIPKDNDKSIPVPRQALLEALRRVALMSSDKTWGIRFVVEKGKLRVESDNPDLGTAKEEIDVAYKGGGLQIGFNARYIIDLLTEIDTPDIRLELSGELDPGVIRPADDSDYVGVIMPMRI